MPDLFLDKTPLFEARWLSVSTATSRDDVLLRIAEAERRAEAALEQLGRTLRQGGIPASGAVDRDRRIDALLALETRGIPASGTAADGAVERVMMEVGFRKRDLMPRFHELAERCRAIHRRALAVARDARWALMLERAAADPGGPSSPIQGTGTRYVKSDRYDARAARSLPPDDRVRADRFLKRLGEDPVPPELELSPLEGTALWGMKAGNGNRFILRRGELRGVACFFVEDVGPYPDHEGGRRGALAR
ncbi:hypothetical protein Sp245p_02640 [Azospirillum baldaniorum]|uniref:Uncharacterized protein n=1 Tax=Azospirillum baldaniorum TaxID=1064539 RepID=A0A9P1JML3_9PROT|nr:hypothetical protein [Azospirillum baldaniorum]AWJ88757.1 hypothetical protein Sp245p_02640 [Azospirillum baldaniorum]TWA79702.1 hypothetical protein FBZ85_10439 [Azospirillum brasilense]CCC96257.1 conserved protein of unknown function [Azospirillum baldaniorum]